VANKKKPVADPRDKIELAHNASIQYLDGQPYRLEEVLERMGANIGSISRCYIDIGKCALAIKAVHGHGEFEKIMKQRFEDPGIMTLRTIERSMKVARWYIANGSPQLSYYKDLPRMKQLMLAAADPEDIGEDGSIYGFTPEELKAKKFKELEAELATLRRLNDDKTQHLKKGREQLENARARIKILEEGLPGQSDKKIEEILEKRFNAVFSALARTASDCDGQRFSKRQKVMISGFFKNCHQALDELSQEAADKLMAS